MKFWKFFSLWITFRSSKEETLGARGERLAARHLKRQGMRLIMRNFKNRWGEIDLIVQDQKTLVFVEVRTRSSIQYGDPVETISLKKQRCLSRAALGFLKARNLLESPARFDVITIVWNSSDPSGEKLCHLRNAFELRELG